MFKVLDIFFKTDKPGDKNIGQLELEQMCDEDVVQLVLTTNKDFYEILVNRYWRQIKAYTSRLLNFQQTDSEDVTSQSFIKAYQNLAGFNPRLSFKSWLYRISHNQAVSHIRKHKGLIILDPQDSALKALPSKVNLDLPTTKDVWDILNRMPAKPKNVLIMFYYQGLSIQEIAETLKTTSGSVKTKLSQARKLAKKISTNS